MSLMDGEKGQLLWSKTEKTVFQIKLSGSFHRSIAGIKVLDQGTQAHGPDIALLIFGDNQQQHIYVVSDDLQERSCKIRKESYKEYRDCITSKFTKKRNSERSN
ncbi:hypothetical protein AVEN_40326-1 [Araneus ventricosus]|uniref:Uncharacterized protein n=1 Tax=Araneus ventricosus TaxID=182803 RepID=A0A4Y2BIS8_ARAVE|nr:hypothetical protein AVEN_11477-1 [Araneus ventricosus]GBL91938.1 hypothetical protein AVEN_40326-1 [Araneus ventricosus]